MISLDKMTCLMRYQILMIFTLKSIHGFSPLKHNLHDINTNKRSKFHTSTSLLASTTPTISSSTKIIDMEELNKLPSCKNQNEAIKILQSSLKTSEEDGQNILFNSISIPIGASTKRITDTDLAIQTNIRNIKVMDLIETNGDRDVDRASLSLLCLFIASSYSAISIQSIDGIPQQFEIIRFVIVWILSFLPLFFVGAGLAIPNELQNVLIQIQRSIFMSYKKRMVHHEAGHFLLGYLLGMPVKEYNVDTSMKVAVEFFSMRDDAFGRVRANLLGFDKLKSYDTDGVDVSEVEEKPYFSENGKGSELYQRSVLLSPTKKEKLQKQSEFLSIPSLSTNNPKNAWPYRGLDSSTIDKLTIISVGGICSELLGFGNAQGGYQDLQQLRQFFINYYEDSIMDEKEMENRIKFGISYGIVQLRRHLGVLDDLIQVMEKGGSVQECILAIENCEDVKGSLMEEERRKELVDDVTLIEEFLLYGGKRKNSDTVFERVEGKGGGEVRNYGLLNLSGDDPFYLAAAVASVFLLWASSGGLSLH